MSIYNYIRLTPDIIADAQLDEHMDGDMDEHMDVNASSKRTPKRFLAEVERRGASVKNART